MIRIPFIARSFFVFSDRGLSGKKAIDILFILHCSVFQLLSYSFNPLGSARMRAPAECEIKS